MINDDGLLRKLVPFLLFPSALVVTLRGQQGCINLVERFAVILKMKGKNLMVILT